MNFELTKFHRVATILHPQLKSLKFARDEEKIQTIRELKEMIATVSVLQTTDTERTRRRRSNESVLSDYFDDDHNHNHFDEVEIYIGQKISPDEIDLLKWWDDHKESYPKLYNCNIYPCNSSHISPIRTEIQSS